MTKKHYILYIPGLGDHFNRFRQLSLGLWGIWGVKTELVPMNWDSEKEFNPKLARITAAIIKAKQQGYRVSIIGESAGAPMAINASVKHELRQVITLCGTNDPEIYIFPRTYKRAPAFKKALASLNVSLQTLDLSRVQTIRPLVDGVVSPKHALIPGARNHRLFSFGHLFTISLCLTFLSSYTVSLIKK